MGGGGRIGPAAQAPQNATPEQLAQVNALNQQSQGGKKGDGNPPPDYQGALQQQGAPIDWNSFGKVGTGEQARDQAINAAYGQATSRLDPMWNQREDRAHTRLLNQGLDQTSEAYRTSMEGLGRERNDAYTSALNSAIGQGTQAGQGIFNQGMMSRQQSIAEALRRRMQPLDELEKLQGLYSGQGKIDAENSPLNGVKDILDSALAFLPLL